MTLVVFLLSLSGCEGSGDGSRSGTGGALLTSSDTGTAVISGVSSTSMLPISAKNQTVVIMNDGTLMACGTDSVFRIVAPGGSDFVSAEKGANGILAIKSDGTVWAISSRSSGTPTQLNITGVAAIATTSSGGFYYSRDYALKSDGTVWALYPEPAMVPGLSGIVAIASGSGHMAALKNDYGTVWTWGENASGQLGDGTTTDRDTPMSVPGLSGVIAIAAGDAEGGGESYTLALKSDGTVWGWGYNINGQLGDGTNSSRLSPVKAVGLSGVVAIAAGEYSSYAVKNDGTVWSTDVSYLAPRQMLSAPYLFYPSDIPGLTGITAISAGNDGAAFAFKNDGTVLSWGDNVNGQLGNGQGKGFFFPAERPDLSGKLLPHGQLETGGTITSPVQVGSENNWVFVAAGSYHTAAIKTDGTLWAWGCNSNGQLGDGATTDEHSPEQIGTDNTWVSLAAGAAHTVALKSDGTLWAWGYNAYGQLGDDTGADRSSPVSIGTGTHWVAVAAGAYHTVALKSDSTGTTLWAWGSNYYGQLGDGTKIQRSSPVSIGTGTNWVSVAAGPYHTVAIKSDGTLWAWGYNFAGQPGDGTSTQSNSPLKIGTDTDWVSVSVDAWGYHTLAVKSDGRLCWVKYDPVTKKYSSVQIGTGSDWVSVVSGLGHTAGLQSDGTLWAWGYNSNGQLGDGATIDSFSPKLISAGTSTVNWKSVAAGGMHTAAIKSDGTLWAWGTDYYGQLGVGEAMNLP